VNGISDIKINELKTGDLLFMNHPSCNMSQAIDLVTQTGNDTHYSHIGIAELNGEGIFVYHATPGKGVCCDRLELFLHPDEREAEVTVYRLKEDFLYIIPHAIDSAKHLVGEDYNHSFRIISPGYYCSELIYRIFVPAGIFGLNPMTFKDSKGKQYMPHWEDYYDRLGIPIPESQPGCNPNGMAASDKLRMMGKLKG
jgi:hypothetical protein